MKRLSYKEREKRRREGEILLEARRLIQESGFAGLNMDTLADVVGVSKPTLYQHFKSKEDLMVQVLVAGMQELEDDLCAADEALPLERLKTALRVVLLHRYSVDGLLADFETELLHSTLHSHPDVIAAKGRIMAALNLVVDEGKARGEINPEIDTAMISCLFFRMIGLPAAVQAVLTPENNCLDDPQALNACIDSVVELFTRAIVSRTPSISMS